VRLEPMRCTRTLAGGLLTAAAAALLVAAGPAAAEPRRSVARSVPPRAVHALEIERSRPSKVARAVKKILRDFEQRGSRPRV